MVRTRELQQIPWLVCSSFLYRLLATKSFAFLPAFLHSPSNHSTASCHKLWLSKADFTWLILMSHKVCWISHYDVTWLIVFTWLRTRESLLYFDWLIVSWLTIVTLYDVMTFTHDSHYESWVSRMWLVWAHDLGYKSSMDFALWLTMSHRGLCSARWWVTRVRVVGRCLYRALGSDQEIGSSRNHLSTFLYSRYCNTITLYSLYQKTLLHYASLCSKQPGDYCDSLAGLLEHRTIVIVLSSTTIHPYYYLTK